MRARTESSPTSRSDLRAHARDARPRLLLADDEESFSRALERYLARVEYEVVSVCSAEQALASIERARVDVLIADIHMSGNSSLELIERVRREHPRLPVIIITGRPGLTTAIQALRLGASDYVTKPFDFDELVERIQRLLVRAQQKLQAERALSTLSQLFPEISSARAATSHAPSFLESCGPAVCAPEPEQELWDELSEREQEVVLTFAETTTVADVARTLGISIHTVRNHFRSAYRKLGVHSQAELVAFVRARELRAQRRDPKLPM